MNTRKIPDIPSNLILSVKDESEKLKEQNTAGKTIVFSMIAILFILNYKNYKGKI